jgi:cell wall-associated NlpC family hydrolase
VTYEDLVGIPFKKGGSNLEGFDCYGMVRFVYSKFFHTEIPYYNEGMKTWEGKEINEIIDSYKGEWKEVSEPQVPCSVFIRNHPLYVNHIGVYVGEGKFLQCLRKVGVILSDINDDYWKRKIVGFWVWKK